MSSREAFQAAAAILVLLEGTQVPLVAVLRPAGDEPSVTELDRALRVGSRQARARGLAAALTRLALDMDQWSIA